MEWSGLLGLVCPLMMIGMMVWMVWGKRGTGEKAGGCCSKPGEETDASEVGSPESESPPRRSKRRWLMLVCCLVPVGAAALLLLSRPAGAGGSWLPLVLLLVCPLSHLLLMPLLHGSKKHSSH